MHVPYFTPSKNATPSFTRFSYDVLGVQISMVFNFSIKSSLTYVVEVVFSFLPFQHRKEVLGRQLSRLLVLFLTVSTSEDVFYELK